MKAFASIIRLLHDEYGFDSSRPGMESLQKIVDDRRTSHHEMGMDEYFTLLQKSSVERDHLIDEIVISETFFFRYPESFATLASWAQSHSRRPLRVLSAACSTGEETYSIAMSLMDAGLSPDQLVIEGCDASAASIAAARRGLYQRKAFRSGDQPWLRRYFTESAEGWTISPKVCAMVHFEQANLLSLDDSVHWDVIFCRNALIYFTASQQNSVADRLARMLREDGILFVGSAEPPVYFANGWTSSGHAMSFSLVRRKDGMPAEQVTRPKVVVQPALPKPMAAKVALPPPQELVETKQPALLDQARNLADQGRLVEAQSVLDAILRSDSTNGEAHFLCGVVAEVQGHAPEAEAHYRKTLYVTPDHAEALQHMILLLKGQGRSQAADNLSRRVARHAAP